VFVESLEVWQVLEKKKDSLKIIVTITNKYIIRLISPSLSRN